MKKIIIATLIALISICGYGQSIEKDSTILSLENEIKELSLDNEISHYISDIKTNTQDCKILSLEIESTFLMYTITGKHIPYELKKSYSKLVNQMEDLYESEILKRKSLIELYAVYKAIGIIPIEKEELYLRKFNLIDNGLELHKMTIDGIKDKLYRI